MAIGISRHGSQLITASGVINPSGDPIIVYGIHILSSGGGAAVVSLRNGTSGSATIYITETGTVSTGKTFDYGEGFFFPAGCYVSIDGNTTSVLVSADDLLA